MEVIGGFASFIKEVLINKEKRGIDEYWWQKSELWDEIDKKETTTKPSIPDFGINTQEKNVPTTCRPQTFKEYIGQEEVKSFLKIMIEAGRARNKPVDHLLFYASPGMGKTSLAYVIANELKIPVKITTGSMLTKPKDIYETINELPKTTEGLGSILFIDEIHGLGSRSNAEVAEQFYSILEDFEFHYMDEDTSKSHRIKTPHFTCIGATTARDKMDQAFLSRFIDFQLQDYTIKDLSTMITGMVDKLNNSIPYHKSFEIYMGNITSIDPEATQAIAERCRGIPRQALIYTKLCRDYAVVHNNNSITQQVVYETMAKKHVDGFGLRDEERKVLTFLVRQAPKQMAGANAIASSLGFREQEYTTTIEPFLLRKGFIIRTPRGRQPAPQAIEYVTKLEKEKRG